MPDEPNQAQTSTRSRSNAEHQGLTVDRGQALQPVSTPTDNIPPGSQPPPPSGEDQPSVPVQDSISVQQYLDRLVNDARIGRATKSDTVKRILDALGRVDTLTPAAREKAFESYLVELNTSTWQEQAPTVGSPIGTLPTSSETEGNRAPDGHRPQEEALRDNLVHLLSKRGAGADDLDDELSVNPKRQRYSQADMPWHSLRTGRRSIDHELSYARTCELLELYGEDLPRSKFLVRTASNGPEGIPSAQWERILKGEALNLDHFLSSIVCTSIDEDRKARIGTAQLTFSTSEAKRKIRTYGDWIAAWRRASRAITFAFPHRADELDDYLIHIQAEFDSKHVSAHHRVILYVTYHDTHLT